MRRRDRIFEGSERAVRFAHSLHRHDRRGHPFLGAVLIVLGGLFLLDNLDVLEARNLIRNFWPSLLVAWGGYHVVTGRGGSRVVPGIVMAFGGVLLGNRLLGWGVDAWDLFWPVLLMGLGLSVLFNSRRDHARVAAPPTPMGDGSVAEGEQANPPPDGRVDASASFREIAVLAGIERRNISQTFRGGEITAVMGGVEIDLRECRMGDGEAYIDVFVLMGGVELRIPRDWTVESRVTAFLAGADDRSEPPAGPGTKRLVIRGTVFMGGVEIRN